MPQNNSEETVKQLCSKYLCPFKTGKNGAIVYDKDLSRKVVYRMAREGYFEQRLIHDFFGPAVKGFLIAAAKVDMTRSEGEITAFLIRGVEYAVREALKKEYAWQAFFCYLEDINCGTEDGEVLSWEEIFAGKAGDLPNTTLDFERACRQKIESLPESYRPVFWTKFEFPALTAVEIAAKLGMDAKKCANILTRGRKRLKPEPVSLIDAELKANAATIAALPKPPAPPVSNKWKSQLKPAARRIVDLKEQGKPDGDICRLLKCSLSDIHKATKAANTLRNKSVA